MDRQVVGTSIGHGLELVAANRAHVAVVIQVFGSVMMVQFGLFGVGHGAEAAGANPLVNLLDVVCQRHFVVEFLGILWTHLAGHRMSLSNSQ